MYADLISGSTWAFIGPFWFPDMLAALGGSGSGGLMAGLIFVVSWLPVAFVQWRGKKWRKAMPASPTPSPPGEKEQMKQKESAA